MGWDGVLATVPRHERHLTTADLTQPETVAGRPEGSLDPDLASSLEQLVKSRSPEDPDHPRIGHQPDTSIIRSIARRARAAISAGTVIPCFRSRSESRTFSRVIVFM